MALTDVAVRIVGLLYAWWWEEYLPKVISMLPPSKAEWYVSPEDIAQCFMNVPTKTVEAVLLKTNASNEIVKKQCRPRDQITEVRLLNSYPVSA